MKNIIEKKMNKIIVFVLLILFFTFLYTLFDETNFTGINKVTDIIKDEIVKEEVKEEVKDEVQEDENISKKNFEGFQPLDESYLIKNNESVKDKAIEFKAKKVDRNLEKEGELSKERITPNIYIRTFDRLYFSISTGALLGYGDVHPNSTIVKCLSMFQAFSTICLIVF